jgi:hypothetical protein
MDVNMSWRNIVGHWLSDKCITQGGGLATLELIKLLIEGNTIPSTLVDNSTLHSIILTQVLLEALTGITVPWVSRGSDLTYGMDARERMMLDLRQCLYVMKYVHRLPFTIPRGVRNRELSELPGILIAFFEGNKGMGRDVFAYKGGHFEKDLLRVLEIPCIDLEEYGCPKAKSLFGDLGWLETCGNHIGKGMAYEHCPKVESEAYGSWITNVSIRERSTADVSIRQRSTGHIIY